MTRRELYLSAAVTWTDSLVYWGGLLCTCEDVVLVSPYDDATMYLHGIQRAIEMLDDTFAHLSEAA